MIGAPQCCGFEESESECGELDGSKMIENTETRDQRYKRQTAEQFAALGAFVQAFEQMVHAVRIGLLQLLTRGPGPRSVKHQRLLNIVFHHHAMTAQPLFEIFRFVIAEIIHDEDYGVLPQERDTLNSIFAQLASDITDMCRRRNDLVHGTWMIGAANAEQTDFSEVHVARFKGTKTGLAEVDMPKDIEALEALTNKCIWLSNQLYAIVICLIMPEGTLAGSDAVQRKFRKTGGRWEASNQTG
jgi:hypothetical protein